MLLKEGPTALDAILFYTVSLTSTTLHAQADFPSSPPTTVKSCELCYLGQDKLGRKHHS